MSKTRFQFTLLLVSGLAYQTAALASEPLEPDESGLGGTGRAPALNVPDMDLPVVPELPESLLLPEQLIESLPELPMSSGTTDMIIDTPSATGSIPPGQ